MTAHPTIDPDLLSLLRCPQCRGELALVEGGAGEEPSLDCATCALRYPVRGGVPVLLVDDAVPLP